MLINELQRGEITAAGKQVFQGDGAVQLPGKALIEKFTVLVQFGNCAGPIIVSGKDDAVLHIHQADGFCAACGTVAFLR